MSHTPGPWSTSPSEPGQVIVPSRPKAHQVLADVYGDEEQAEIDALLMAAAPDLLAACERLLRWASWPHAEEDIAAARAAIAKAKGKP